MLPTSRCTPTYSACSTRSSLPVVNGTLTKDDYLAHWAEWEKQAPPDRIEQRELAVAALRDCLERKAHTLDLTQLNLSSLPALLPEHIETLNIYENELSHLPAPLPANLRVLSASNNNLTTLPPLPKNLSSLSVSNNHLMSLPENLPPGLINLNLYNNTLESLPATLPATLRLLDLNDNQLIHLPGNLPDSLQELRVADNMMTCLPDSLPPALLYLDVRGNLLITLPPALIHMSSSAHVHAEGNPLSERALRELFSIAGDRNYHGPQITFSMCPDQPRAPLRPLHESVANWLPAEKWAAFEREANATAFSTFLMRLGETINSTDTPTFCMQVVDWLRKLEASPSLREKTFALALDATTSCEDRVTLAYNNMQQVALAHEVESGMWDGKLTGLIAAGREMFCLEQLEQIARDRVKTLRFVDEIEVYLAYQTALRQALQLTTVNEKMRYYGQSGLTAQDLNQAVVQVRSKESSEFPNWLAKWAPWKSALQRLNPQYVTLMQEKQKNLLYEVFPQRVKEELAAAGVDHIPDAEAVIGRNIWQQLCAEQDVALTKDFLLDRYLAGGATPETMLEAVSELVGIATVSPPLAATLAQSKTSANEDLSSRLALLTEKGGMAPLAGAWISLLHLLYKHHHMSGEQVLSLLLPQKNSLGSKSLAYTLAGADWSSEATARLCGLLAEIARSEEPLRPRIIGQLSIEQAVDVPRRQLARPADFYKLAKRADAFLPNSAAKVVLRQNGLIPAHRALYRLAPDQTTESIEHEPDFATLQDNVNNQVSIATRAAYESMQKEKADLKRAKIAGKARYEELKVQEMAARLQRKEQEALFAANDGYV